jgi:assimilatory nitrate reductase catalytic subunit
MSIEPAMNISSSRQTTVRTTCPYCGVGCGILVRPDANGISVAGDPDHPANFGNLCSKGSALGETLGLETRLLHPMIRDKEGVLHQANWDAALTRVANGFKDIVARHGPNAVAFYLSGQLLTEDYYVANKLMKGFIGSANVDTNSRLCMASAVSGHKRAFGADVVPGTYDDLDHADLILLVGSNAAWCHPVLFRRIEKNRRERGAKLVVIDPRFTQAAEEADLFLPIGPGQDSALFSGLLAHLDATGALDLCYAENYTEGLPQVLTAARRLAPDIAATAALTGLPVDDVAQFFDLFRTKENVVTCFSQGVNQSAQGTDKVNAILNCHLATGRIGKKGQGPFSLTGQPNAMGGREVGGLANQLAAHMGFSAGDIGRVQRFWDAPNMARQEGLKAVQMFEAIERGEIKALWVMATNPAASLPRAGAMRNALAKLGFFAVSDNIASNDTLNAGAHVLLPAAAWGERDGTATNSERRISRQRPFLPLPGDAKPDWWIVSQVAQRMGFANAFSYRAPVEIFCEHASLSGFENGGTRAFDISGLSTMSNDEYENLTPVQWPVLQNKPREDRRFFAEGGFFTGNGKARFIAPETPSPKSVLSERFPLRLNTGRIRDQWHTMTRTGLSPRLALHVPEPFVEIHPDDIQGTGIDDGGFARVSTEHGSCVLKVVVSPGQRKGSIFAPIHWSAETASSSRVGELVAPFTDPYSGQPEAKATPARLDQVTFAAKGFVLARIATTLAKNPWWARVALSGGWGYRYASNAPIGDWRKWARAACTQGLSLAEFADEPKGIYRAAIFSGDRLELCLFFGPRLEAPQWDMARSLFAEETLTPMQRHYCLSGRLPGFIRDAGPLVCACFGVGRNAIAACIQSSPTPTVEHLGRALKAGTNCGSCLPELKRIIVDEQATPMQ